MAAWTHRVHLCQLVRAWVKSGQVLVCDTHTQTCTRMKDNYSSSTDSRVLHLALVTRGQMVQSELQWRVDYRTHHTWGVYAGEQWDPVWGGGRGHPTTVKCLTVWLTDFMLVVGTIKKVLLPTSIPPVGVLMLLCLIGICFYTAKLQLQINFIRNNIWTKP